MASSVSREANLGNPGFWYGSCFGPPQLIEKWRQTLFKPNPVWAAILYLLYALLILVPSGIWTGIFLPAGAIVVAGRLYASRIRTHRAGDKAAGDRGGMPAIASDLAVLIVLQQGVLHAHVEWGRGNILGLIISLAFVTPLLALLTRTAVHAAGRRLWYPFC